MWTALEWAAWIVSGALIAWMVFDAYVVGRDYGEDVLLSSREGVDELFAERKGD
jgi:hypothetical protein